MAENGRAGKLVKLAEEAVVEGSDHAARQDAEIAGVRIGVEELSKVGRAERAIKELGFRQVRVRVHGDVARVEVESNDIPRLVERREAVTEALKALGYRFVTIDLEGFRSGSMNPPAAD